MPLPLMLIPPAGLTEAAMWEPEEVVRLPQPVVVVPKLDPTNGEQLSLTQSDDPTFQAIAAEFRTVLGTGSAVKTFGHKLNEIRKNDTSAPTTLKFEVDRILKYYLDKRLIIVDEPPTIVAGPDAGNKASITLRFTVRKTRKKMVLEVSQ
jgi:hypothetical protein